MYSKWNKNVNSSNVKRVLRDRDLHMVLRHQRKDLQFLKSRTGWGKLLMTTIYSVNLKKTFRTEENLQLNRGVHLRGTEFYQIYRNLPACCVKQPTSKYIVLYFQEEKVETVKGFKYYGTGYPFLSKSFQN